MIYKALGLMSGSSLDGLDIAYVHFHETAGKWSFELIAAECFPYNKEWTDKLKNATSLGAFDYQVLHTAYGRYLGDQVNFFISKYELEHQVDLIASHGHTTFHEPALKMTAQLGDGAAIAAVSSLPVISDLRALDVALSGQGAPIVPIGEKLLFPEYDILLNLGGIANLSFRSVNGYTAFDVCAANRVLNMLANEAGKDYDKDGEMAASGKLSQKLFDDLNNLPYYQQPFPKSLSNQFGTETVFPAVKASGLSVADALHTYAEHITAQVETSINNFYKNDRTLRKLLVTGGGALNSWLVSRLNERLTKSNIELSVPGADIINYKEALIMALIGVLRWREEYNVMSSVTGAVRDSIGGALWLGTEA
jgi:anhydro-N-acetylmuramic acid kinase